ncbi:MAG: DUF2157 domain-containing protein [Elusimicrobia bacterium]|nr:DUF2157 domain-containing protein [Elusimicrobiota bacterium]
MDFISDWRDKGLLRPEQAKVLLEIENDRIFSISAELRALLYLGALLIVAGVGGTVKRYVLELGPVAISGGLSFAVLAGLYYCFSRGAPYSSQKVESPTPAFDYVLYMSCAFWGILFGYLETHYHLLAEHWDYYLLLSSGLFFWLAYRFDNRLVLAMALTTLGSWFGLRFSHLDLPFFDLRTRGLGFGTTVVLAGWWLENRARIKDHFADTYYNVGLHVLFWTLLWGLFDKKIMSAYTPALAMLTTAVITYGLRRRSFQYFLYGTVYGYIGLSYIIVTEFFDKMWSSIGGLSFYFLASSVSMLAVIFYFRRRLEQDA